MYTSTEQLYELWQSSTGICTDSRKLEPGQLFWALRGDRFDGNQFARQAIEQGAVAAIVDNESIACQHPACFLVQDSLKALQSLAQHYRKQLDLNVLAIAGSNGKTTTKELCRAVLATRYTTFATPGNLNNHIGVPLTLLHMPKDTQIAVIELGANHIGEIQALCQIALPTHGLITNIGLDHLEGFGSIEGVAHANRELFDYLLKHEGIAFVNRHDPWLMHMASHLPKVIYYPEEGWQPLYEGYFAGIQLPDGMQQYSRLFGKYNFYNIAAALSVAIFFGIPQKIALQAIGNYQPQNQRSQLIEAHNIRLILDAYNANPSSMEQAITSFAQIPHQPKMVILGDMLELGNYSQNAHEQLGKLLQASAFEKVVLFGKEIQAALPYLPRALYFADKFSLHNWLNEQDWQGYHVLIKGSRSMQLESVVPFILKTHSLHGTHHGI